MNKYISSLNFSFKKTAMAFLIAPWAVIPALLLPSLFMVPSRPAQVFEMVILFGMFGVPIAYVATLIIGLPTHILLRSIGINKVYPYSLSGAIAVLVFSFTLGGISLELLMYLLCGVTVATTFGFMVKERA